MSAPSDPSGAGQQDPAPFLPDSQPAAPVAPIVTAPTDGSAPNSPFLPSVAAPVPTPLVEPVEFDAKAMVESQKRFNANPAYGPLPTSTEASREASEKLRDTAKRKRRRDKRLVWFVGILLLGGAGAAGWFGYQAYQDEQDQRAADRAAEEAVNTDGAAAATPLGEQVEVIGALDDLNSTAQSSAGAGRKAIDDLQDILASGDGATSAETGDAARPVITIDAVLPDIVVSVGERLPDLTGRETYVVRVGDFSAGDPAAFAEFIRLLASQPQLSPADPAFADFPAVDADQLIISVERTGDVLERLIVAGNTPAIHVDYAP